MNDIKVFFDEDKQWCAKVGKAHSIEYCATEERATKLAQELSVSPRSGALFTYRNDRACLVQEELLWAAFIENLEKSPTGKLLREVFRK